MKCPNCQHETSSGAILKCSSCGQGYERSLLEESEHIQYALNFLRQQREVLGPPGDLLVIWLEDHNQSLLERMHLPSLSAVRFPPSASEENSPLATRHSPFPTPIQPESAREAAPLALVSPQPAEPPKQSAVVSTQPAVVSTQPAVRPKAAAPARPAQPALDWSKLVDRAVKFVVSGMLLRALLYLGAFMIVVSATVLVVRFWGIFPFFLQIFFIFAIPSAFFLAGWWIRARLKLSQAGTVISGVGSILLGVDFAALYQLANLRMDISQYWLMASLLCTAAYIFNVWKLDGEFFDYLAMLAGGSSLVALTRVLQLPLEWTLASLALYGLGLVGLSVRLEGRPAWQETARAARLLPQLFTPLALLLVFFITSPWHQAGQMVTALFAAGMYALLVWKYPSRWRLQPLLVSLELAAGCLAWIFAADGVWVVTAAALLAALFILVSWRPPQGWAVTPFGAAYRQDLRLHGYALSLLAAGAAVLFWILRGNQLDSAIPLSILALSLCAWQFLLKKPVFAYLGLVLLLAPFYQWLALLRLEPQALPLAYALLVSLGFIPAGLGAARWGKPFSAPFYRVGFTVSLLLLCVVVGLSFEQPAWSGTAALLVLFGLYAFSVWRFQNGFAVWGAALALPFAFRMVLDLWAVPSEQSALYWGGLAYVYLLGGRWLAGSGGRASGEWRVVGGGGTLVLGCISLGVALAASSSAMVLLTLAALLLLSILAARLYRSSLPLLPLPLLGSLWAYFFFYQYGLAIFGRELLSQEYSPMLAGVALLYFTAGLLLDRLKTRYAHVLYAGAYVLLSLDLLLSWAASALDFSKTARQNWELPLLLTFGLFLLLMLASAGLVLFNRYRTWNDFCGIFGKPENGFPRLVRSAFLWPLAWLLPVWINLLLQHLHAPPVFLPSAVCLTALLYLFVGRWLERQSVSENRSVSENQSVSENRSWENLGGWFAIPFFSAAHVFIPYIFFTNLNFVRTNFPRILALERGIVVGPADYPEMGALLLVVPFYASWAALKKQALFAHLAAWLSILPVTALLLLQDILRPPHYAIVWTVWGLVLLLTGFLLDHLPNVKTRYAHGPTLAGILLAGLGLAFSSVRMAENLVALGLCILAALLSFLAVHFKQHPTFDDFLGLFNLPENLFKRGLRLVFLFFAAYAFPVWLLQLMSAGGSNLALRGLALAGLAPVYIGLGWGLGRVRRDYTWPFYSAAYTFTCLGAWMASAETRLLIPALFLDVAVFATSAVLFRKSFWLYLATCLLPLPLVVALDYNQQLTVRSIVWWFTGLAFAYFACGQLLERVQKRFTWLASFPLAFYLPAYPAVAVALLLAPSEQNLALIVYPLGVLFFFLSAWRFRQPLFYYPAAWLATVPYSLLLRDVIQLPLNWLPLGWLPLILGYIALGRFAWGRVRLDLGSPGAILRSLRTPQAPFYFIAYGLSLAMLVSARSDPRVLTAVCAAGALLYLGSALLFRHPAWLYPSLLVAHLGLLAYFSIYPSTAPLRVISLPFLILTALEALAGVLVSARYPVRETDARGRAVFKIFKLRLDFGEFPSLGHLSAPSWAQPIFIMVLLDTVTWEGLALSGLDTGRLVSLGFFLLFAGLATWWGDRLLAYLAQGFAALALACQFASLGLTPADNLAWLSGFAFGLYLLSWFAGLIQTGRAALWAQALRHGGLALSLVCLVGLLPGAPFAPVPAAMALGFAGALYLSLSLQKRTYLLGYLGMGLMLAGWALFLFVRNVAYPQLYALPAGLYFSGIGFIERRRRPGLFALIIESFGLAVLLTTSFVQSLQSSGGFPYFLMLLVESLLVIWWGAARRLRVPFLIGLVAGVLNILAQLVVLVRVYDVNRWIVLFGVGILLVIVGLTVERRREKLLAQAQDFRGMLERWD